MPHICPILADVGSSRSLRNCYDVTLVQWLVALQLVRRAVEAITYPHLPTTGRCGAPGFGATKSHKDETFAVVQALLASSQCVPEIGYQSVSELFFHVRTWHLVNAVARLFKRRPCVVPSLLESENKAGTVSSFS